MPALRSSVLGSNCFTPSILNSCVDIKSIVQLVFTIFLDHWLGECMFSILVVCYICMLGILFFWGGHVIMDLPSLAQLLTMGEL